MEYKHLMFIVGKAEDIFRSINRKSLALGNASVSFELEIEMDDFTPLIVKRSWSAGTTNTPRSRDLENSLISQLKMEKEFLSKTSKCLGRISLE